VLLTREVREAMGRVLALARELAEQMDAAEQPEGALERRLLRAVEEVEGAGNPAHAVVGAKLHAAPLALTPDGTVFVGAAHLWSDEPHLALQDALAVGAPVFLGVAVDGEDRASLLRRFDDAGVEAVARIAAGWLQRRRRESAHSSERSEP
jgi:hypothetical protein